MPLTLPSHSFEVLFAIPSAHRLEQVRSRSRGGLDRGEYWEHKEYDGSGHLVASYCSFSEVDPTGVCRSGWRKYDSTGSLVAKGVSLLPETSINHLLLNPQDGFISPGV